VKVVITTLSLISMNAFETTLDQANSPFKQLVIGQYDGTELLNKLTIEGRDREIF